MSWLGRASTSNEGGPGSSGSCLASTSKLGDEPSRRLRNGSDPVRDVPECRIRGSDPPDRFDGLADGSGVDPSPRGRDGTSDNGAEAALVQLSGEEFAHDELFEGEVGKVAFLEVVIEKVPFLEVVEKVAFLELVVEGELACVEFVKLRLEIALVELERRLLAELASFEIKGGVEVETTLNEACFRSRGRLQRHGKNAGLVEGDHDSQNEGGGETHSD